MKKWTEYLDNDTLERLKSCSTRKKDLPALVRAKWRVLKEKGGYVPEDAVVSVLELLDENGRDFGADMTVDEYNELVSSCRLI